MTGQKRDRAAANRAIREADWNSLRARYEAGEPMRGLAAEAGIAVTTMRRRLVAHGTRMRTGTRPIDLTVSDTDLRTAYAAGATITALAREHGCSTSLIWRRLNFHTPLSSRPGDNQPTGQPTAAPPTVLRMPDGRLPVAPICAEYTAGATLRVLAKRWQCSMSGIRSVLTRGGVVMRAKRTRRPVEDDQIIQLRDQRRLAWAVIADQTGLTEEALRARYISATGGKPAVEWHRHPSRYPHLNTAQLEELNSVIDRRPEIVNAYLTGQASARQLARDRGISDTTVRRWAKEDRAN